MTNYVCMYLLCAVVFHQWLHKYFPTTICFFYYHYVTHLSWGVTKDPFSYKIVKIDPLFFSWHELIECFSSISFSFSVSELFGLCYCLGQAHPTQQTTQTLAQCYLDHISIMLTSHCIMWRHSEGLKPPSNKRLFPRFYYTEANCYPTPLLISGFW